MQVAIRRDDRKFARGIIKKLPNVLRSTIAHQYKENYPNDYRKANLKLVELDKLLSSEHLENQPLKDFFNEERLDEIAEQKSQICRIATAGMLLNDSSVWVESYCGSLGLDVSANYPEFGLVKRSYDHTWWKKQLRKLTGRSAERIAIQYGVVGDEQIYCSDFAVARYRAMKTRNRKMLENTYMVNEHGDSYTLQELSDKTVANPSIRRGELMTRIRGFEEFAKSEGKAAVFITVTCPSKYHAKSGLSSNQKYIGADPRRGQNYHVQCWARSRAAFARNGIHPYGFRIAEPHKDGTPHWHTLLFVEPDKQKTLVQIINKYWKQEDGNEPGAHQRRVQVEFIDSRKGSAAGYIAKYIAKNIDGYGVGEVLDINGNPVRIDAASNAERVSAWASLWGIRQFQQIGGVPVGVYRTLRRIEKPFESTDAEQSRINADQGNWDLFTRYAIASSISLKRELTGEVNRYDELLPPKVVGVESLVSGEIRMPKSYVWEAHFVRPWTCVNNCTRKTDFNFDNPKIPINTDENRRVFH